VSRHYGISVASSEKQATYKFKELSWSAIVKYLRQQYELEHREKDCGNIVGGKFKDDKRAKANAEYRSLLALDADNAQDDFVDTVDLVLGCAAILYTTWKNRVDGYGNRLRLFAPLSRDVTPDEYWFIVHAVMRTLGVEKHTLDKGSAEAERLMHLPSSQNDRRQFVRLRGTELDADAWLARARALGVPSRGQEEAASGAISATQAAYDGPEYSDLEPGRQREADAADLGLIGLWQRRLAEAVEWDDDMRDDRGRGWEALVRDCAYALACRAAAPWSAMDVAAARDLFEQLMPDEIAEARSGSVRLGRKLDRRTFTRAAKQPADLPPWESGAADDFGVIEDEAEPERKRSAAQVKRDERALVNLLAWAVGEGGGTKWSLRWVIDKADKQGIDKKKTRAAVRAVRDATKTGAEQ